MRSPEILAPAGSIESLYAALPFADAVYTGSSRFSARAFAKNPSVPELQKALTYAHLREKKIYLTVNTLLNDAEMEELYSLVCPLYEYGLDACIVQDLGVLSFLHENFPDMPLHASTQMTLFSGEEAELLKPLGVTRYVPARELTIEEVRQARRETDLEIEVFVHGALCYCYSGQCLMSQVIGGRSGNRGMCAQPCRLSWHALSEKGHFLSTKDICTLTDIPDLLEAGIDSFKIEGRMKSREYSAYTAYLYRKYTDFFLENGRDGFQKMREDPDSPLWRDFRDCQDVYNRGGFSRGFLFEKRKESMVCTDRNGHFGRLLGQVQEVMPGGAVFSVQEDIHYQDVLEFREEDGSPAYEYTVKDPAKKGSRVKAKVGYGHVYEGQKIYRMRNAELLSRIDKLIEERRDRFPLTGEFSGEQGLPCELTIRGAGVSATVRGAVVAEAEKRPVTEEDIRTRLDRLGNTGYRFEKLDIQMDDRGFLPLGSLKQLRRDALAAWEAGAVKRRERDAAMCRDRDAAMCREREKAVCRDRGAECRPGPADTGIPLPRDMVSVSSMVQAGIVKNLMGSETMLHVNLEDIPGRQWPELSEILENCHSAVSLPRILRGRARENFERQWAQWGGHLRTAVDAVLVDSFAAFLCAGKIWPEAQYLAGDGLYMENEWAAEVFRDFGIFPAPVAVYGRKTVMVTESCVFCTLGRCGRGRQTLPISSPAGDEFFVVNHCQYCYNTIYTRESMTAGAGERKKRLVFTLEGEKEIREVMERWNL